MTWRARWERVVALWGSPIPARVLRLIPSGLVIATLVIGAVSHDPVRLPYPLVLLLAAVVVVSNFSLLSFRSTDHSRLRLAGVIAFMAGGSALWYALPQSVLIILPFWGVRVAVRYRLGGRFEYALILLGIAGASVPTLLVSGSPASAIGVAVGVVALVLGASNRRAREERFEELEVSLARKQSAIEEHARAAALAERARIARDVHDVLAHSLAGLSLNLQGARLILTRDGASPEAIDQVTRAQRLAAEGLTEARRAVAALREDSVPDGRALADLVTAYRLDAGVEARFEVSGVARELPADAAGVFYRGLQEALTNVRKYAPGAPVDVILGYGDGQATLTVTDHPGKPPARAAGGGYGLVGMRERAQLIGGTLEAGPTEDGWQISLAVPT
jgi:signal transduction histidine kinase